ncbi:MAG TPA: autotransporter domain-containing protein [Rhodobacteraceae bacterium]|nr:autotransporter domain-containing protein [Paracoccaceae bacterium]
MIARTNAVRVLSAAGAVALATSVHLANTFAVSAAEFKAPAAKATSPVPTTNFVPVPPPPPPPPPNPPTPPVGPPNLVVPAPPSSTPRPGLGPQRQLGPATAYIAGRFAGSGPVVTAPAGAVIPDDFCLPGKFEDCGDHLRDQPQQDGDGIVYFGDPAQDFQVSRNEAWASAQFRLTEQTGAGETLDSTAYSLGVDRRFGDRFLLGLIATSTNTSLRRSGPDTRDRGTGFLYGAYFAVELSDNWAMDGRALTGTVNHTVETAGVQSGTYTSQELHAALRFSGEFSRNSWRFNPSIEVSTMNRNDAAYVDTISGPVSAQDTTQTFVTGTLLAYYDGLNLRGGSVTPYIGLEVSQQAGSGSPSATARAGLSFEFGNGGLLNIDYAYGAIGLPNVNDSMLTVQLEIPF